jgi:hypothetical protein
MWSERGGSIPGEEEFLGRLGVLSSLELVHAVGVLT